MELVNNLETAWEEAELKDNDLREATNAIRDEIKTFPLKLKLKVSIGECSLSPEGKLMFRGRLWVPDDEELRTKII